MPGWDSGNQVYQRTGPSYRAVAWCCAEVGRFEQRVAARCNHHAARYVRLILPVVACAGAPIAENPAPLAAGKHEQQLRPRNATTRRHSVKDRRLDALPIRSNSLTTKRVTVGSLNQTSLPPPLS